MTESQNSKDLSDERLRKLANRNDVIAAMAQEILGLRYSLKKVVNMLDRLNDNMNLAVIMIDDPNIRLQRAASSKSTNEFIEKIKREFAL